MAAVAARESQLTKPPGALGRLEELTAWLAGWQRRAPPRLERVRVAVFAGWHGVAERGVSAFPAEVTGQMVANFEAGGAAINQLARLAGAELVVRVPAPGRPTADFTRAAAMSEAELEAALAMGAAVVEPGLDLLILGEMGIANTTAAAALCAALFGGGAAAWAGAGTGLDAGGIERKVRVIDEALAFHGAELERPREALRRLGGHEIAAILGAVAEARCLGVPVLLDGFVVSTAAALLHARAPEAIAHCRAAHRSAERAHGALLERLALAPLLDLGLRLGEGTGAALAVPILRAALACHNGMATFAEAEVSGKL